MIAVLLLAAGAGRRLGAEHKLLVEVGGESMLRRAARAAVASGVGPLTVVLGSGADVLRRELGDLPCQAVVNPEPGRGMNSTLAVGLAALPTPLEAVTVLLADMPGVDAAMIGAVAERFRAGGVVLAASRYGETVAPPVTYGRALLHELAKGPEGDGRGREVVRRHIAQAGLVDWPAALLHDVDDPRSLEAARAQFGVERKSGVVTDDRR